MRFKILIIYAVVGLLFMCESRSVSVRNDSSIQHIENYTYELHMLKYPIQNSEMFLWCLKIIIIMIFAVVCCEFEEATLLHHILPAANLLGHIKYMYVLVHVIS